MEAAIGIEPMNKGFAVRLSHFTQSATWCYVVAEIEPS
jgi:hypothetical protein